MNKISDEAIVDTYFRAVCREENFDEELNPIWTKVYADVHTELQPDNRSEVVRIDDLLDFLSSLYGDSDS